MSGSRARRLVLTLAVASACHDARDGVAGSSDAVAPRPSTSVAPTPAVDAQSGGGAPRCSLLTAGAPADALFGDRAELGEVTPFAGGFAFGALRSVAEGGSARLASILRVGATGPRAPVDLGAASGDAPAPQPLVRGDDLYAIAYLKREHAGGLASRRALSVHHVTGASVERLVELPAEADASSAYDVIASPAGSPLGAVVVWDSDGEAHGHPPRGVVQVATLTPDLHAVRAVRTLQALAGDGGVDVGDAGDPRVALRTGGYWLTWLVRHPEHAASPLPLPAGEIETPSEEATYGWIEAVALDAEGALVGAGRRLTSTTGHVGSYATTSVTGALLVIAEDEGSSGRAGGSLEQVVWRGEGASELVRSRLVRSGVEEETPPALIAGSASAGAGAPQGEPWLSFLDVRGESLAVPIVMPALAGPTRSADEHPVATREPLLAGARLLGSIDGRMGLAVVDGARWALRWASCLR